MKSDEGMTAAKKVTSQARLAEENELNQTFRELRGHSVLMAESEQAPKCALEGCEKFVPEHQAEHRFCSRRHYYKSLGGDGMKTRAIMAAI